MSAAEAVHHVRPEVAAHLTPVADLHNHPANPRRGDVERLAESLQRFGQYRAIVADQDGTILAGNHTYRAAVSLGWTHVAATRGTFSEQEAEALLVADNRHSDLSTNDDPALLAIIQKHNDDLDTWLAGTGFTLTDVSQLEADVAELGLPDLSGAGEEPDPDDDPGTSDAGEERGSKLALVDVSIADPVTQLDRGDVVRLGPHVLLVESVYTGWARYAPHLDTPDALMVPYPTPTLPMTERARRHKLVLVQPDPYLAGHLVDKYVSVYGDDEVHREAADG